MQKQFEEEGAQERLRLLAKRREPAFIELKLKQQLLDESDRKSNLSEIREVQSKMQSFNLYNDLVQLHKCVEM